jgi:hypothetical protein
MNAAHPRILKNGTQEQVHFGADPSELPELDVPQPTLESRHPRRGRSELPELDVPQPTEPPHFGSTFTAPSKQAGRAHKDLPLARFIRRLPWLVVAGFALLTAIHFLGGASQ